MNEPVDLDRLDALYKASTPGEWQSQTYSNYAGWSVYGTDGVGCIAERWYATGTQDQIPRNDQFIAHLHNNYEAMAGEIRARREAMAAMLAALELASEWVPEPYEVGHLPGCRCAPCDQDRDIERISAAIALAKEVDGI